MLRLALGTILSLLPRRWRRERPLAEALPWQQGAVLSGLLESLLALAAMVYWYSYAVVHWSANAFDSAMRNGPEAQVPGQAIGFSALVLWALYPQTWGLAFFVLEGLLRSLAAAFTGEVYGTAPLAFVDWCYGKITGRPPDGDDLHRLGAKTHLKLFASAMKEKIATRRLPKLADELIESEQGGEKYLEIHASRPKSEWTPPRIVRVGAAYFRLEQVLSAKTARPFVYRLRQLPAGVPGRTVIVYEQQRPEPRENPDIAEEG